ncbi:MAG: tetratricopeptide repeat protein [Candidatus Omnitrophica bacterium]|nr:tetratricopeptide repeat protein [Candidatus Omnitrophota bacterium]
MKRQFIALMILLLVGSNSFGETIVLNSGKTVEGKIVQDNPEEIKFDVDGILITYYKDDIASIDGIAMNKEEDSSQEKDPFKIDVDKIISEGHRPGENIFAKRGPKTERYMDLIEIGKAYAQNGEYFKARDYFKRAIGVGPYHSAGYIGLGTAYLVLGRYGDAERAFQIAKQLSQQEGDKKKIEDLDELLFQLGTIKTDGAELHPKAKKRTFFLKRLLVVLICVLLGSLAVLFRKKKYPVSKIET